MSWHILTCHGGDHSKKSNLFFPFSWECHYPNWRTHIFQRGGPSTNQPLNPTKPRFSWGFPKIFPLNPINLDHLFRGHWWTIPSTYSVYLRSHHSHVTSVRPQTWQPPARNVPELLGWYWYHQLGQKLGHEARSWAGWLPAVRFLWFVFAGFLVVFGMAVPQKMTSSWASPLAN